MGLVARFTSFTPKSVAQIRVRVKDAGFVGKGAIGEGNHRLRALIAVRLAFSLRQVILGVRQPLKDFFIKIHTISANAGLRSNAQEMSNGDIEIGRASCRERV